MTTVTPFFCLSTDFLVTNSKRGVIFFVNLQGFFVKDETNFLSNEMKSI